ncbi:hypothetical protein GGG16DRAFT_104574 [Schizophyllum commune]
MLPRHLTLDHGLPKDAGFYTTSDLVIDAKLHALSYTSNPRNLEAPFYGLHNTILSELFDRHLITHPQYVLYTSKHEAHPIIKRLNNEALAKEAATSSEGSAGSDSDTTSSEPSSSSVPSEDGHSHSDEADESAGVVGPMGDVAEAAGSVAEDGGSIAEVAGSVVEDRESIDSAEDRISDDGSVADAESSIVEYGGGVVDTAGSVAGDSGRAVDAEGNTAEAGDYDADRMSIAYMHTVSVPEALSGVPDFAGIFSIVIDMEGGPTQVPPSRRNVIQLPQRSRGTAETDQNVDAQQPEPEAESETQARKRRAAQACSLYDGEYLLWERVIFLEEDKHNPGRGAHWSPGPNLDDPQINKLLQEAQKDLIDYLFILFYLVDKNAKTVVVRATAGVFWCWACINREDVPLYTMPTPNSDLRQSLTLSERAKADALIGKWSETFVVGRLNSDAELTKMRKKVFEVIGNDAPVALVRKRLVTRDQMENM